MRKSSRSRFAQSLAQRTIAGLLLACTSLALCAQEGKAPNPEAERTAAAEAALKAEVRGPTELSFSDQAKLQLPEGYGFIPLAQATRVMKAMGNTVDPSFLGLIVPRSSQHAYYVVRYTASGYIKDDDAKDWNADKLLEQIREGTVEGNKHRVEVGLPEMEIGGWIQPPKYDPASHEVIWSIAAHNKGSTAGQNDSVNYKTLVLGRDGYMALTLVTRQANIDELRPTVATLLDGLKFVDGKRYADFNSSTDHVAEFGLAALIAGVAAKKLGLLALIVAFVVKFAKVIVVAVAGIMLALRKRLGLKKAPPAATATPEPTPPGAAPPTDSA